MLWFMSLGGFWDSGKCSAWRSASGSLGNAISEEQWLGLTSGRMHGKIPSKVRRGHQFGGCEEDNPRDPITFWEW